MAKPDWGSKHTCQNCGAKYYDLNRKPITCPRCSTEFNPDALLRSRRARPPAPVPVKEGAPAAAAVAGAVEVAAAEDDDNELAAIDETDEELVDDEGDDDEIIEDASELGEDDEMAKVMIGGEEPDDG